MERLRVSQRQLPVFTCALLASGVIALCANGEAPEQPPSSSLVVAESLAQAFRHTAEIAESSVVTIRTVGAPSESPDDPEQSGSSDATGVIVDSTGGILTSLHAVEDAEAVFVRLPNGREFRASDVRGDPPSDLAIVRITGAGNLKEARFGNSDQLHVGDWVVAVGNSFGLGVSTNPGTVSSKPRKLAHSPIVLLQTNAVSNPGNSGGALMNLRGEVVGICAGGYSIHGGFDGIAFAVPSNVARFVTSELCENGVVRWPYLGASFETLSPEVAQSLGLRAGQSGVIITEVVCDGAAAHAGLQVGDVITAFSHQPVPDALALSQHLLRAPLHESIEIGAIREGEGMTRIVRLPPRPSEIALPIRTSPPEPSHHAAERLVNKRLGLTVAALTAKEREGLGVRPDLGGVLVEDVDPHSEACFRCIEPGAVVTHVALDPVATLDQFDAAIRKRERRGDIMLLVCWPGSDSHFIVLQPKSVAEWSPSARSSNQRLVKGAANK